MKTSSYKTVESLPRSIHFLKNLSKSTQKNSSCIPGTTVISSCKPQSLERPAEYLQLVQQAEQYMMAHLDDALSIDTLCSVLYVSRRTLHNAFREVVGVGPMTYLKIQRMKHVHHQLEQAHPLATTVFDTAYQCGFWHMGHFSRDYKQMFGELPSDTLKREPVLNQDNISKTSS